MTKKTNEHVIILHGLGLYPWWMTRIVRTLNKEGYNVHNIGYPSRKKPIRELTEEYLKPAIDSIPKEATHIHFIVHSLGSILVRQYHALYTPPKLGRTVMLGPPNKGSKVADFLSNFGLFKCLFGPAGMELVSTEESVPAHLGPLNFEAGVIAGTNYFLHPLTGPFIPKPNDGLVCLESTKIEGMKDHITIRIDHSLMVLSPKVIKQSLHFLKEGSFYK